MSINFASWITGRVSSYFQELIMQLRSFLSFSVCTLIGCLFHSSLMAWGQTGHRVTGAIADELINDHTRKHIHAILGKESLARGATWPDEMRSNQSTFWQKTASPWHYVTVPKGKTYQQVGAPKQGDSVTALEKFTATLQNSHASMADKQLALRFIVHIIGDLHQPLHAGNGTDRGGNDRKVTFFYNPSNLHRVWDSGLIDGQQLSYTEWTRWLLDDLTLAQRKQWHSTEPKNWIAESVAIRPTVYPPQGEDELSWDYTYQHKPIVKRRLLQGGVRIADYLDSVFASLPMVKN